MKSLKFTLLLIGISFGYANAQTIVYEMAIGDLVGLELTSGDICTAPFTAPEEAKQMATGNQWGCTWMSTGSGSVSTITVEFGFSINDQLINIPTLLNATANNTQTSSFVNCDGSTVSNAWTVDPSNYNVGGTNTFLVDYAASTQINQLDHLYTTTDDIYMTVTVLYESCTPPTVALDQLTDATCNGDADGAISISVTGGGAPYTYDWDIDGTGDFDDNEDLTGLPAGTYTVIVMEQAGCTDTIEYTVGEPAALDTSVTQIGSNLQSNATGVSYQWIDCSGPTAITGATNQIYVATADGDYAVVITDGPCSDTSACYTVTGAGLFDLENEFDMHIFPNPGNGKIFVEVEADLLNANIRIYDMSMKLIQQQQLTLLNGQQHEIDLTALDKGVYFFIITTESNGRSVRQITLK